MSYKNVTVLNHPLISHKVALLRDKDTRMKDFRELVEEITALMAYESFRDLPTKNVIIDTPLESVEQQLIDYDAFAIIPILRAGIGMVNGIHRLIPTAPVGHIGLLRNAETLLPEEYFCKLPQGIEDKVAIILDPMLATGGSANAAIALLKAKGCKKIKLMSIIAAPEGVKAVAESHQDISIYIATLDRCLNEKSYILPGLGDAGDRLFGTK